VNRNGQVEHLAVGDAQRVYLPDIGRARVGAGRFRGLRLIRTFITPTRKVELSAEDITDLSQLRLDAVISVAVGPGGYPAETAFAYLVPDNPDGQIYQLDKFPNPAEVDVDFEHFILELEAEFQKKAEDTVKVAGQPAMLILVATPNM